MAMKNDTPVIKCTSSSSEMLEASFRWNIPSYELKRVYRESLVLSDTLKCTIMLVPKEIKGIKLEEFYRVFCYVFFTKIPSDKDRPTYFQYILKSSSGGSLIAYQGFKKATLSVDGYRAEENNITISSYKRLMHNEALEMDLTFYVKNSDHFKSLSLDDFKKERTNLAKNYSIAFNNPKLSDITIICDNNEQIPAHKAIFAARSPVFAQILDDQVTAYNVDVSKEALIEFLRFLYCDTINSTQFEIFAIEILELAQKFEITELANLAQRLIFQESLKKLQIAYKKFSQLNIEDAFKMKNFGEIGRDINNFHEHISQI